MTLMPESWFLTGLRKMIRDEERGLDEQERRIAKRRLELERFSGFADQMEARIYAEQQQIQQARHADGGRDTDRPEA